MTLPINIFDIIGAGAACFVLLSYYATSLVLLRTAAIVSNVLFINYAVPQSLWPIAALHALLLPLNVWRLVPLLAERRRRPPALKQSEHEIAGVRRAVASGAERWSDALERNIWEERRQLPAPEPRLESSYLGYIIFALGMLMLTFIALKSLSDQPKPNVCEFMQTGNATFCAPVPAGQQPP